MDYPNHREFTRCHSKMPVQVTAESQTTIDGTTQDVSMSGIFVVCEDRMPVGTRCRIAVELSGGNDPVRIEAQGRVARVDPHGMGIQINEINLEAYEHMRRLVLYNASDSDAVEDELRDHIGLVRRRR